MNLVIPTALTETRMISSYPDGSCLLQCIASQIHQTCTRDLVLEIAEKFQAHIITNFDEIYENEGYPRQINVGSKQRDIQTKAEVREVIASGDFHLLWLDHREIKCLCTCLNI